VVAAVAQSVELADLEFSKLYEDAAASCLRSSDTRPEYKACVSRWDAGVRAVARLRLEVFAVQVALDTWEATGKAADFKQAACHFIESAAELRSLLADLGVDLLIPTGGVSC